MILLISDLHLDPQRPAITQAFYHFLNTTAQGADALYILGDFFEVWLGDDDDTPLYAEVISKLHRYSGQGHNVYFMHGNRDFLVGEDCAKRCGMRLLNDPTIIYQQQSSFLLMHGDSLCTKDNEFMQFRQMTRSKEWQTHFLAKPLEDRKAYAAEVRQQSKSMNSLKADDIMDVTEDEVVYVMTEAKVNTLIHGHTHRPNRHRVNTANNDSEEQKERIVLGDWGNAAWYIRIQQGQAELLSLAIT